MTETSRITPSRDDLVQTLARALFCEGRRLFRPAQDLIPVIVAAYLVDHLEHDGFVVMKKPPIGGHSLSSWMPPK
jgi:hypothetical protein